MKKILFEALMLFHLFVLVKIPERFIFVFVFGGIHLLRFCLEV